MKKFHFEDGPASDSFSREETKRVPSSPYKVGKFRPASSREDAFYDAPEYDPAAEPENGMPENDPFYPDRQNFDVQEENDGYYDPQTMGTEENENYYDPSAMDENDPPYEEENGVYPQEEAFPPYDDENLPDFSDEEDRPKKKTIFKPQTRKPSFVLSVIVNSFRMLVLLVLILGLAGAGTLAGIARGYVDTAPTLDLAAIDDQAQTSFIYDADGNLITDYKGTENRVMVSIDTMPKNLQHAFVAVEDARFYTHKGVDVKRIVGSFIKNYLTGSQQGGSTITQQLIKNTLLSSEKSYKRKIQEAYLAMQLESRYTKDQILESYLNTIYLGEDYYGVKVAAFGYFGKEDLNDLTIRECAMLAGTCNSPYYYNPRRNFYIRHSDTTDYAQITNNRTDYVLRCMYENQFITREQYQEALNPLTAGVLEKSPESTALYPYPHYVEYAVREAVQILLHLNNLENTSANRNAMEHELRTGGYQVFLALDTDIQTTVENSLYNWNHYPSLRDPSDSVYRARNSDGTYDEIPQPQAAAVVMDYRTGEVKAIVGSRTKPTQRKTLNRATDMNMPVGSSIKPLSVYAPAIELGAGAGSILYNMPLPISGWRGSDGKDSWPKNYGGSSYRGPETLRKALVKSDNTAAAYALLNFVGVDRAADFLLQMGVKEEHIDRTPFGVSLGSSGLSPFEMAAAFGVLANGGVYQSPITVLGIFDPDHKPIYDAHQNQERRQVFKPSTAYLTVDILKEAVSSGTGTKAKIKGQTVAGKTGTNSDQKGVFFSGMTGWYSAALWIGHDNYKALSSKTTGGNSAAKLWQSFMSEIHQRKGLGNRDIMEGSPQEYGLVKLETCAVSGQLATDACRRDQMGYGTVTDWWPADTAPNTYCQMHVEATLCTASNLLATENCPLPNRVNQSVVIIPRGHPLYRFIGTSYQGVLQDYLGSFAALRLTEDENANRALLASKSCTVHQYGGATIEENTNAALIEDAKTLLSSARLLLSTMNDSMNGYQELRSAIQYLEGVLSSSPDLNTLAGAMGNLTQAMAGAQ